MSADKYPSIFSRQMKAIVYLLILLQRTRTTDKQHIWNPRKQNLDILFYNSATTYSVQSLNKDEIAELRSHS